MPQPHLTTGKDSVPIVQEAGWASGPVWTGAENLAPTGIRFTDCLAHRQSLYQLRYLVHWYLSYKLQKLRNCLIPGTSIELFCCSRPTQSPVYWIWELSPDYISTSRDSLLLSSWKLNTDFMWLSVVGLILKTNLNKSYYLFSSVII